jgi:hypothetical protein
MKGETLHISRKALVEVALVLAVYLVFLAVGVVSGQMTMTVEVVEPLDGASLRYSPVQLAVRIAVRGKSMPNITVSFDVYAWGEAGGEFDTMSNMDGIATLLVPATSGNYTWYASASKAGYPTINSGSESFSVNLSLNVKPLSPSTSLLATSPVDFRARVTDTKNQVVESANVTFYADMANIGSAMTAANGIARLSKPLSSGMHTWFASATKDDEGGISGWTQFLVGAPTSLQGNPVSLRHNVSQPIHRHRHGAQEPVFERSREILTLSATEVGRFSALGRGSRWLSFSQSSGWCQHRQLT